MKPLVIKLFLGLFCLYCQPSFSKQKTSTPSRLKRKKLSAPALYDVEHPDHKRLKYRQGQAKQGFITANNYPFSGDTPKELKNSYQKSLKEMGEDLKTAIRHSNIPSNKLRQDTAASAEYLKQRYIRELKKLNLALKAKAKNDKKHAKAPLKAKQ